MIVSTGNDLDDARRNNDEGTVSELLLPCSPEVLPF
jgi:hypothetical protein